MTDFVLLRHKSNGVVKSYPAHYLNHPVFGPDLELYVEDEFEEDKVVSDNHELPVEQRGTVVATETKSAKSSASNKDKEN